MEQRFLGTPDGNVWDQTTYAYAFWKRYLRVFDSVNVVSRVLKVDRIPDGYRRVNGPGVTVTAVPYYLGPIEYAFRARKVRNTVEKATLGGREAIVLRIPSNLVSSIESALLKSGRPFGVEVVGDPEDVFSKRSMRHPLRRYFRWLFVRQLKRLCRHSSCASYVTKEALQLKYPPGPEAFSTHYSSIELPDEAFRDPVNIVQNQSPSINVSFVGTFSQLYKGQDVLIDAVRKCVEKGCDIKAKMIGGGRYQKEMERFAEESKLSERVRFLGQVPAGQAVRELLDSSDIFILPARTEGLPRAMIEAMARGLPCIGTEVGGIPELLDSEHMVPVDDSESLSKKIIALFNNKDAMSAAVMKNFNRAREYHMDILYRRRDEFYSFLKKKSEKWQSHSRGI
jgi:glycosyltransferase involved in cell wall biosynthesis